MYKFYVLAKNTIKKFIPKSLLSLFVLRFHFLEAVFANFIYGFPSKNMKFIGVTGTNGKTSTTLMVARILEGAGYKVGMNTTAITKIGNKEFDNKLDGGLTNANPITMQKLLKRMKKEKVEWVAMESSSQALHQHRLWGISFVSCVVTNVTNEHLDYHKTFEKYAAAKSILLAQTKGPCVLNTDDEFFEFFKKRAKKTITYGKSKEADFRIVSFKQGTTGTTTIFEHRDRKYTLNLKVEGMFNAYNAIGAIAATHANGVNIEKSISILEELENIVGRMDEVKVGQKFRVFVDYAHTPDAVENVLSSTRKFTKGRLITVTGAAGERPKSRRAPVGKIASKLSDVFVATDDEPFSENAEKIRAELISGTQGVKNPAELHEIPDRCQAIKYAVSLAGKDDTVMILGMGRQKYRSGPSGKQPWDDKEVTENIIRTGKTDYCKH